MQETIEQIKRDAYTKGQQLKQQHLEQQRVVNDAALAVLAADFAHVALFKFHQQMTVADAHTRAGLCAKAFEEGYKAASSASKAPLANSILD